MSNLFVILPGRCAAGLRSIPVNGSVVCFIYKNISDTKYVNTNGSLGVSDPGIHLGRGGGIL